MVGLERWSKLGTSLTRDVIPTGPITTLREGLEDKGRKDRLAKVVPQSEERSGRYQPAMDIVRRLDLCFLTISNVAFSEKTLWIRQPIAFPA